MSSEQRSSPTEDDLTATRRAKLADLRARGVAYPNDFAPTHHAGELHASYDATDGADARGREASRATVAGRMVAKRDFGKASFVRRRGRDRPLQIYVRARRLATSMRALRARSTSATSSASTARLFRTKTNELTVEATRARASSPRRCGRCPRSGTA